ncbi:hypothetical protein JVU11DRAFT_3974 [Chiua virens]|nr:hypothetical protein JVU11DRAFT_3974 [Chiua virens]
MDLDASGPSYHIDDLMDIDDDHPRNSDFDPSGSSDSGEMHPGNIEEFPGASQSYLHSSTFMDQLFSDEYSKLRKENVYYLFASQQDWQLALWLLQSCLSMAVIDSFLSLQLVDALTNIITHN